MRDFDPVFYITAVGDSVYFGSSSEDCTYCLDAKTGKEKWVFFTDAPVRFPPSWYKERVYVGSDDGHVYCLDAKKGTLIWKYKPSGNERCVPSNGKLISLWPCRTGVLVQDGKVYFGASLLPWEVSYLCAVDADTGSDSGAGLYKITHNAMTMQGAMLASPTRLYLSQGRQMPIVCDLTTGKTVGSIGKSGDGGVYALLTEDSTFIHGHGQNHRSGGELRGFDAATKDYIATFPSATCMIATGDMAYIHSKEQLSAFDRNGYLELKKQINSLSRQSDEINKQIKKLGEKAAGAEGMNLKNKVQSIKSSISELTRKLPQCTRWKVSSELPHALILAGDVLFAGGNDIVAAYSIRDGTQLWYTSVAGKAHGLVVANGHLFVSTDKGKIYCFTKIK
ncbi:MAG: outer membrane protein assembly factor BamB family protein [Planctomycetota bacterium]